VRGGISRSYFIEAAGKEGEQKLICLISRDTDELVPVNVPEYFQLKTNTKVQFTLHSSATRLHDQPGDRLDAGGEDVSLVAPLVTVLQYGKGKDSELIDVELVSQLTEVGTLELSLQAIQSDHSWPLRFDLRAMAAPAPANNEEPVVIVDSARLEAAKDLIRRAFTSQSDRLPKLNSELEEVLELKRDRWSVPVLRELADQLLDLADRRTKSERHEVRWLNLAGFCMRPGLGDAADELRIRKIWKMWFAGPKNDRTAQVLSDWWVFWRRIAPGLKEGHQQTIASVITKAVMPKGAYRGKLKEGNQAKIEMWRCLGALERITVKSKQSIGRVLLERADELAPHEFWVLARLGARNPFHAPVNCVLSAAAAGAWVRMLTAGEGGNTKMRAFAIARIGALTGERLLDIDDDTMEKAKAYLEACDASPKWIAGLTEKTAASLEEQTRILGDSVPPGLMIKE
jgi:hypothetical protein